MGRTNVVIERTGKERRYFGVVIYFTSLVGLEKKKNLEQELARVNSLYYNHPSLLL